MHHACMYRVLAGINDADVDMSLITANVEEFNPRNNHLILSEQYELLGAVHSGVSVTRARLSSPTLERMTQRHIWPVMRSALPVSDPRVLDLRMRPWKLPLNEEIKVLESGNLGAATEEETTLLILGPAGKFSRNLPEPAIPGGRLLTRFTGALAHILTGWATAGILTATANLIGGWWGVAGAWVQDATARAFRLNFPRFSVVNNRKMRPGATTSAAIGDIDYRAFNSGMGLWGIFHSFELPTIDVYADAAGASTQEVRMDLIFLGEGDPSGVPPGISLPAV